MNPMRTAPAPSPLITNHHLRNASMLIKILLVIGALIAVFLIVVATRPGKFSVSRAITIAAPPATAFTEVDDFHRWQAWSPFEKLDPAMTRTHAGAASGVGAIYRWSGNSQAGEGSMTIVESRPHELIRIRLDFVRPLASQAEAVFTFANDGEATTANWTMHGESSFVCKAVGMFMSMDTMLGRQFEDGLAALKAVCEGAPKPKADAR